MPNDYQTNFVKLFSYIYFSYGYILITLFLEYNIRVMQCIPVPNLRNTSLQPTHPRKHMFVGQLY